MHFVKNLIGGLIIMVVATGIGVAQNSIRGDGVTLFPRIGHPPRPVPAQASMQQSNTAGSPDGTVDVGAVDPSPQVTQDELDSGTISMERVKLVMDAGTAVLIDARGEHEYEKGHLPGAINIPYESFVDYYRTLEQQVPYDATVIVYCTSVTCDLGEKLIVELRLMDYENVVLYPGGWDEWSESGYPSEGGESSD